MGLTQEQLDRIAEPVAKGEVKTVKIGGGAEAPYIPAATIKRSLNEVFGVGGWDFRLSVVDVCHVGTLERKKRDRDGNMVPYTNHCIVARAVGSLTIRDHDGNPVCVLDDVGHGTAEAGTQQPPPFEQAEKSAVSDCLKRCAHKLGTRFGLSLYDEDDRWGVAAFARHQNGGEKPRDLDGEKRALAADAAELLQREGSPLRAGKLISGVAAQMFGQPRIDDLNQLDAVREAIESGDVNLHTGEIVAGRE